MKGSLNINRRDVSRCTELFTHLLNADQSFSLFICVINFVQLLNTPTTQSHSREAPDDTSVPNPAAQSNHSATTAP